MKKQISLKKISLIGGLIILFAVAFSLFFMSINKPVTAEMEPDRIPGPELKVGRYYVDGDINQYYLDVTAEGTIQLKDVDYLEYANWKQTPTEGLEGKALADQLAAIDVYAEDLSKAYTYNSITFPYIGESLIATEWSDSFSTGYGYIDENTLSRGSDEIFIYVDENAPVAYSAPEKITRIVDAVKSDTP